MESCIDRNESNETRPQREKRRDSTFRYGEELFERERSRSTFVTIYIYILTACNEQNPKEQGICEERTGVPANRQRGLLM